MYKHIKKHFPSADINLWTVVKSLEGTEAVQATCSQFFLFSLPARQMMEEGGVVGWVKHPGDWGLCPVMNQKPTLTSF